MKFNNIQVCPKCHAAICNVARHVRKGRCSLQHVREREKKLWK